MEGFKPYGWYLTLVQFAFYSIFGLIELQLIQDKRRRYVLRLPASVESERKKKKTRPACQLCMILHFLLTSDHEF